LNVVNGTALSLWRQGATRAAILDFVARVTRTGSRDYVPPESRVAVFDNDGTLWCEKPLPIQADFLLRHIGEQAERDPSLRDKQPWKAVWERDHKWLSDVIIKHYRGDDGDLRVMGAALLHAYEGETTDSYAEKASEFLHASQNPVLKRPYLKTAYAPMVELLHYLAANGFTSYIVSGGSRDFMRPVTEELYGIPPERVVGTSVALEYRVDGGVGNVYHKAALDIFNDGPTKVVRIWSRAGCRPILAAGNSNGDIEMLEFTAHPSRPSLSVLVNHDDDARDIAYTAGAEKALDTAKKTGWTVASVRNDWDAVFAD